MAIFYIAGICLISYLLIFDRHAVLEYYTFVAANKESPVFMGAIVVSILLIGYLAHEFKKANQRLYGYTEILFALISSISALQAADLLTPIPAIAAIGAATYLVQRGFNNVHDAKMRPLIGARSGSTPGAVMESGRSMGKSAHRWFGQPDWWTALFSGMVAVTAVCGLWYASSQLEEAHGEAQIQHLTSFVNEFDQEPMATYRKVLADKRLNAKDEDPPELYRVLDFYEKVALLVDRGYLNEDDVRNQFGYWMLHLSADSATRAHIDDEQKKNPGEYGGYLRMVGDLQKLDKENGGKLYNLTDDDVKDFYREELTIVGGTPIPQGRPGRAGK